MKTHPGTIGSGVFARVKKWSVGAGQRPARRFCTAKSVAVRQKMVIFLWEVRKSRIFGGRVYAPPLHDPKNKGYSSTPRNCFARMPTTKDTTATPTLISAISQKRLLKG